MKSLFSRSLSLSYHVDQSTFIFLANFQGFTFTIKFNWIFFIAFFFRSEMLMILPRISFLKVRSALSVSYAFAQALRFNWNNFSRNFNLWPGKCEIKINKHLPLSIERERTWTKRKRECETWKKVVSMRETAEMIATLKRVLVVCVCFIANNFISFLVIALLDVSLLSRLFGKHRKCR